MRKGALQVGVPQEHSYSILSFDSQLSNLRKIEALVSFDALQSDLPVFSLVPIVFVSRQKEVNIKLHITRFPSVF